MSKTSIKHKIPFHPEGIFLFFPDGHHTINLKDGDKYIGHVINEKFKGHGRYEWRDGKVYEGNWVDGKRNGNGKQT